MGTGGLLFSLKALDGDGDLVGTPKIFLWSGSKRNLEMVIELPVSLTVAGGGEQYYTKAQLLTLRLCMFVRKAI